ncbi:hypothetical protein BDR26DRAFT_452332 [Obelidium mucronatum]|nr:hypothetical protein BDR26DRAFT_452332 [Obelidium mucronatum]
MVFSRCNRWLRKGAIGQRGRIETRINHTTDNNHNKVPSGASRRHVKLKRHAHPSRLRQAMHVHQKKERHAHPSRLGQAMHVHQTDAYILTSKLVHLSRPSTGSQLDDDRGQMDHITFKYVCDAWLRDGKIFTIFPLLFIFSHMNPSSHPVLASEQAKAPAVASQHAFADVYFHSVKSVLKARQARRDLNESEKQLAKLQLTNNELETSNTKMRREQSKQMGELKFAEDKLELMMRNLVITTQDSEIENQYLASLKEQSPTSIKYEE